ncbi:zinc ABC transporter substrate-binding protein [Phaeobacter sp.]|uniref:zinc ABC transporter substrate-binding protein n=1 Tax=Phaeobacter sp. TaxID=1902409 RepID=UPI0025D43D2E|nr:zinc ABC transporter substrate-binding protein [Phaeobacter sp.]
MGSGHAIAEAPNVATDIGPVHGLVARVMEGVGSPDQIVPPGASPHSHSMRPSEARALDRADVVFWVGHDLTPWLEGPIETLAADAVVVELLEAEGTQLLTYRESATFALDVAETEAHDEHDEDGHDDHGHKDHDHKEHGHEDHDHEKHDHDAHGHEDAHDDHKDDHADHADHANHDTDGHDSHDHDAHDHEEHAHEEHGHDAHGHDHAAGGTDPHAWLMAENGKTWLSQIAQTLASVDAENADLYLANAAAGQAEIDAAKAQISSQLADLKTKPIVVFHDAYQYFEVGFDLPIAGAIALSDASDPSPARIAAIQETVRENNVDCVLSEPQFNSGLVATVMDGTTAKTAVVDPIGSALTPGPQFYVELLTSIGSSIAACK